MLPGNPVGIRFVVKKDLTGGGSPFQETDLVAQPSELLAIISALRSPLNLPSTFTLRYYIGATLLALDFGLGTGRTFKLSIERGNQDLKRVVAEAFGVAVASLLMVRDLRADFSTFVQVQSNHLVRRVPGGRSLRPDLYFDTTSGHSLLECKGTTWAPSKTRMLRAAVNQVKGARLVSYPISGTFIACTFVPLEGDPRNPTIWAGDPVANDEALSHLLLQDRVATRGIWLHYSRVANMAGLPKLAAHALVQSMEPVRKKPTRQDLTNELASVSSKTVKIAGRECIGTRVSIPILSPKAPQDLACPRYEVDIGLDVRYAQILMDEEPNFSELESIKQRTSTCETILSDGVALRISAITDKEQLDPTSWWSSEDTQSQR